VIAEYCIGAAGPAPPPLIVTARVQRLAARGHNARESAIRSVCAKPHSVHWAPHCRSPQLAASFVYRPAPPRPRGSGCVALIPYGLSKMTFVALRSISPMHAAPCTGRKAS
jgi:hypothetical protein